MKIQHTLLTAVFLASAGWAGLAGASTPADLIRPIQEQWAEIKYKQPEKQQAESYNKLAVQARKIVESNPNVAETLIWEGIVLSSEAGAKGGLGALGVLAVAKALGGREPEGDG